jgi:hypothetical protein
MVQRLIASAVVVMAMGSLGWAAGAGLADPFRARQPLPNLQPSVAPGCHLAPQMELLTLHDDADSRVRYGLSLGQQDAMREQLLVRTAELSSCAKAYGEPGAQQLARVTVMSDGLAHDVRVKGPFVSEALRDCVEEKTSGWSFQAGPLEFVLTLPVQYCPVTD